MDLNTLKALLEIGWPAIITFFFGYLAMTYITDQKDQIAYLRKKLDEHEAKIRSLLEQVG